MQDKPYNMHLIINTHWDREYRWSFRETQIRLVEAVDQLIDIMEKDSRFRYFHTDSQASFLDDYLEIRPGNRARVRKLVGEGRLLTGPWYTLPTEFMVSGEALVRNLLMGHRVAKELGGVMKAGYNIFSWGQVSQLPQVYRQFGMDAIMFYRGIDQSNIDKLEFWWEAPDGTRALGLTFGSYHRLNFWVYVYLPYIGKCQLSRTNPGTGFLTHLCDPYSKEFNHQMLNQPCARDIDKAMQGMEQLLDTVKDKSSTSHLLFLQGFDQENPDPVVPDLVDAINQRIDYGKITVSDLPTYIQAVKDELKSKGKQKDLTVMKGEMLSVERSGDPFAPLYIGTFSARMPLKQLNSRCEYRLEKWAEPAAVWARMLGIEYPQQTLRMAWKEILQNQQHDGIGGCHMDRVTPSMIERYANAEDLSETVTRNSLNMVISSIDFARLGDKEIGLTVFNPSSCPRSEVMVATIDIPVEWRLGHADGTKYRKTMCVDIFDAAGRKVDVQMLANEDDSVYAYVKYGSAFVFEATRLKIAFQADNIPALGYACFTVRSKSTALRPVETIAVQRNVLENEFIKVVINGDGTLDLYDKQTKATYRSLHYFEDGGEAGGPLIHWPPVENGIYTTQGQKADIALVKAGPLMATYRIRHRWHLPECVIVDMKVHVPYGLEWIDRGPTKRSEKTAELCIATDVTLRKGSRVLEFSTVVENNIKDHRLRVMFPTHIQTTQCRVDSPFDVPVRTITVPDSSGWYESAARTLPSHSFVDVNDSKVGLTVIHNGLPEYEVVDNPTRTIAITMLRCFGTAGNPTETWVPQPLAQCQGSHTFYYAVHLHAGGFNTGIIHQAEHFNAPMRAAQCTAHSGTLPPVFSFVQVEPSEFIVTAIKKAEEGDAIIIRGYNPDNKDIRVRITLPFAVHSAQKITMEELPLSDIKIIDESSVELSVSKGEIASIAVDIGFKLR